MLVDYLKANSNFEMRIEVSREDVLLDTGGGLKKAAWFFLEHASSGSEPFILHNVDVLSAIDLARIVHSTRIPVLWLPWQCRSVRAPGSCFLTTTISFAAAESEVIGNPKLSASRLTRGAGLLRHPRNFSAAAQADDGRRGLLHHRQLSAACRAGERIRAFHADEYYWRDLGKPDSIRQAAHDLAVKVFLR